MSARTHAGLLARPWASTSQRPLTSIRRTRPTLMTSLLHTSTPRLGPTSSSQPTLPRKCPSCGAPIPLKPISALCSSCSGLLPPPPPSATLFDLFNLSSSFSLDQKQLKRQFLQYQQKVHPDLFSGQGEKESWAKNWSGKVNDGYKLLQNGRSRGEYLLSLSDVTISEADSVTDPELLMSIMETREALEEAATEEEVEKIRKINQGQIDDALQQLEEAFGRDPADLQQAKNLLIQLKYLENVEEVCREWSPGKRVEIQH